MARKDKEVHSWCYLNAMGEYKIVVECHAATREEERC